MSIAQSPATTRADAIAAEASEVWTVKPGEQDTPRQGSKG